MIDGRFRELKKGVYKIATKIPMIGYKKKPFKALNAVSMEIHTGMFGLLGPNGAGKTTLMRIICGIFEQSYGKIFINGIDTQKKREELQGLIGYLPQEFGTYENLTSWEFLEYQALLKGIYNPKTRSKRITEVLEAVHMYENKDKKKAVEKSMDCRKCGAHLTSDEKAIYMKLVSRTASSFLCMDCLAEALHCERKAIEERIRYYRESGNCVLFR